MSQLQRPWSQSTIQPPPKKVLSFETVMFHRKMFFKSSFCRVSILLPVSRVLNMGRKPSKLYAHSFPIISNVYSVWFPSFSPMCAHSPSGQISAENKVLAFYFKGKTVKPLAVLKVCV